ncbi:MAG: glycosyltransferase family A protein [Elusimicrobiota bacterium]
MARKVAFHCLHWDNVDPRMVDAHKKVMKHFDLEVRYHGLNLNHGLWMNSVLRSADGDVIVFIEPDCIPLNKQAAPDAIRFAEKHGTFVGLAQVANHIPPKSHIYAAPGFFVIARSAYERLGRPSFSETARSDTAEELSYLAEEKGLRYRALLPTHFEGQSSEGLWPLGPLGYYGIGTVFQGGVYHLYRSRLAEHVELFLKRCGEVVDGTFSTEGFHPSAAFAYEERSLKVPL